MFASVFLQLSARLRRALAYIKAFAFLEDLPRAVASPVSTVAPVKHSAACAGDRRRGPGSGSSDRPRVVEPRCGTSRASAGRSGRPAPPAQRCATPIASGPRGAAQRFPSDRRADVAGGFLHR